MLQMYLKSECDEAHGSDNLGFMNNDNSEILQITHDSSKHVSYVSSGPAAKFHKHYLQLQNQNAQVCSMIPLQNYRIKCLFGKTIFKSPPEILA